MTLESVDFSYLDNALRTTLDDESTPELYTSAFIDDDTLSLIFYGDEQFDDLPDEELIRQMKEFAAKPQTLALMGKSSPEDFNYNLYRYYSTAESVAELVSEMRRIVMCTPMSKDREFIKQRGLSLTFVEYGTWNGDRYDDMLKLMIMLAGQVLKEKLTPSYIRFLSNLIIRFEGREWEFYKHVEKETHGIIKAQTLKFQRNLSRWADGHIDWAKIAKSAEDSSDDKQLPPALKKEMARWGFDIIFDESVASDERRVWTEEDRRKIVDYNFNDVLGTREIAKNPILIADLKTRDIIRKMYPYTAAKATEFDKLERHEPSARDTTAADLAGLVLIGPKRIKPEDYDEVNYAFPVPDGEGGTQTVDLLDYIMKTEEFIHDYFYQFFDHFRGNDTRRSWDDWQLKLKQPITHQAQMNMPYFDADHKPIDAFARLSTGGAHGASCQGLHLKSEEEIKAWIRSDEGEKDGNKVTIDQTHVIHIDWSSFYPVMASKMKMYETKEGVDRYTGIIEYRFNLKDKAEELWHKGETDTQEYIDTQESQMGLKFVLNNATGAGNQHKPWALLPVDNKTLSMRLIGNMHIYVLGQRLAAAGAYIVATNTDGLFICNMDVEKAQEIIDGYVSDYGMGVEPEPMERFINRDTSNRIELERDASEVSKVGGILRHAFSLKFGRGSIGQNVTYPLIAGHAAIEYMRSKEDWLQTPYDPSVIRDFILKVKNETKSIDDMQAWFHNNVGSGSRRFTLNEERQQRINRVVLTKNGDRLGAEELRALSTAPMKEFWNQYKSGKAKSFSDIELPMLERFEFDKAVSDLSFNDVELGFIKKEKNSQGEDVWELRGQDVDEFELRTKPRKTKNMPDEELNLYNDIVEGLERDKETLKSLGTTTLGYRRLYDDEWQPLKIWKPSQKITGYPSHVGRALNTRDELLHFDVEELDLDAYVRWAESLLKSWKVSANIPVLGMKKIDDTINEEDRPKRRLTKKEQELESLKQFYAEAFVAV